MKNILDLRPVENKNIQILTNQILSTMKNSKTKTATSSSLETLEGIVESVETSVKASETKEAPAKAKKSSKKEVEISVTEFTAKDQKELNLITKKYRELGVSYPSSSEGVVTFPVKITVKGIKEAEAKKSAKIAPTVAKTEKISKKVVPVKVEVVIEEEIIPVVSITKKASKKIAKVSAPVVEDKTPKTSIKEGANKGKIYKMEGQRLEEIQISGTTLKRGDKIGFVLNKVKVEGEFSNVVFNKNNAPGGYVVIKFDGKIIERRFSRIFLPEKAKAAAPKATKKVVKVKKA